MNRIFTPSPIRGNELAERATAIYAGRRARDSIFGGLGLFAEPAWDILLGLFSKTLEHRRISIGDATLVAAVPRTTGLRWIEMLSSRGLLELFDDPHDRRRTLVRLTKHGLDLVAEAVIAA